MTAVRRGDVLCRRLSTLPASGTAETERKNPQVKGEEEKVPERTGCPLGIGGSSGGSQAQTQVSS